MDHVEGEPSWLWRHTPTVHCTIPAQWTTCTRHTHTWNIRLDKLWTCLKWIIIFWVYLLLDIISTCFIFTFCKSLCSLLITFPSEHWLFVSERPLYINVTAQIADFYQGIHANNLYFDLFTEKVFKGQSRGQICLLIIYVYLFCKIFIVYSRTEKYPRTANCKPATSSNHIWAVPIAYLLQRVWEWPGQCPCLAFHNRHRQSTLQGGKRPVRYPLHVTFLSYSLLRPQGAHTRRGGCSLKWIV